METMFSFSSRTISSYPKITLLLCLLLVGCFSIGFVWLKFENRSAKIFVPQKSQGMEDLNRAEKYFRLKLREEIIILVPKPGNKLLSAKCFNDALMVHKEVVNLRPYSKICATLSGKGESASSECMLINPVELFQFEEKNFVNISSRVGAASVCPSQLIMRNGRPSCQNMNRMFGNDIKNISKISDAQAIRIVYYLRDAETDRDHEEVAAWEQAFINMLSSLQKNMTCGKILFAAERSLDDAIDDSSSSDIR
jgi:hypothetical protein